MPFLGTLDRGQTTGQKWGETLTNALQTLAQHKANSMQEKHLAKALEEYNLPSQQANIFAKLGLEGFKHITNGASPIDREAEQNAENQKHYAGLNLGLQAPKKNDQPDLKSVLSNLSNQPITPNNQPVPNNNQPIMPNNVAPNVNNQVDQSYVKPTGLIRKPDPKEAAKQLRHQENLNERLGKEAREAVIEKEKLAYQQQEAINSAERPAFEAAAKAYEAAHKSKQIYKEQRKLLEKGDIKSGVALSVLDTLGRMTGVDLTALKGATAETFDKLSSQAVTQLSQALGGRVTNLALSNFLKQVVTSKHSKEGALQILDHAELLADMDQAPYLSMQEMRKENGGKLPEYLRFDAVERASEKIDKLADEFNAKYELNQTPFGKGKSQTFATIEDARKSIESSGKSGDIQNPDGSYSVYDPKTKTWKREA